MTDVQEYRIVSISTASGIRPVPWWRYAQTACCGCAVGSFVGFWAAGVMLLGPFFLLLPVLMPAILVIGVYSLPIGLLLAAPLNLVFLPGVCLLMRGAPYAEEKLILTGLLGGLASPPLVVLLEVGLVEHPTLTAYFDGWKTILSRLAPAGAIAGVASSYVFRSLARSEASPPA